jgi:hypothetical protein
MAIWLWPGPRFWTEKLATLAAASSRFSTPRSRMVSSVVAAIEKGVSCTVSSRFMAVTVTSSEIRSSRAKSTLAAEPASTRWSVRTIFRKPWTSAVTV